jgi:hypothetical protein
VVERSRWRTLPARALGTAEYWGLSTLGALEDRWAWPYRVDAAASRRRLVRRLHRLDAADRAEPGCLVHAERSEYSQNGEDGAIAEIFRRIGTTSCSFVEIGSGDGTENCTRRLVEDGWTGVWIEADEERARQATAAAAGRVDVVAEAAVRTSIGHVLRASDVPAEPDLVVIDIDSDDLGILEAVLADFRPRVVVVEYNAAFTPSAIWSMPHGAADRGWDGTFRHGASLGALVSAAAARGYSLVHCERMGVNAFFVRADLVGDHFPATGSVRRHHRPGSFSANPFGHPRSRLAMRSNEPLDLDELRSVTVQRLVVEPARSAAGTLLAVSVDVRNGTSRPVTSGTPWPVNLSLRWLRGESLPPDAPRAQFARPLEPATTGRFHLVVRSPEAIGEHVLRATVVCEDLGWRELLGGRGAHLDHPHRVVG